MEMNQLWDSWWTVRDVWNGPVAVGFPVKTGGGGGGGEEGEEEEEEEDDDTYLLGTAVNLTEIWIR
jgi:hypothetical protein